MTHPRDGVQPPLRDATLTDVMDRLFGVQSDEHGGRVVHGLPLWEWDLIVHAAETALDRFNAASESGHGIEARASVGEVLWWCACADEFLRKRVSFELTQREYYAGLGLTSAGRLLGALSFLRNRAGHQIAQVLAESTRFSTSTSIQHEDGTIEPIEIAGAVTKMVNPLDATPGSEFVFAPLEHLPEPDPSYAERFGRDRWYEDSVARAGVRAVLEELLAALREVFKIERSSVDGQHSFRLHLGFPTTAPPTADAASSG